MQKEARCDEIADWYGLHLRESRLTQLATSTLIELLGAGLGRCLDLCCGGGIHASALVSVGWTVVGVDESAEQLRIARGRLGADVELVRAHAESLPFPNASFNSIAAAFVHTDVGDFGRVLSEAVRVLQPGGHLVHIGTRPCFVGPSVAPVAERRLVHSGYRREGWTRSDPGIGSGIRSRVGVHHITLASFLNAFTASGLEIESVAEPGEGGPPILFAIRARRAR